MAKNLLIRDLPDSVNDALEWYKNEHYITYNTDAAIAMIEEFPALQEKFREQAHQLSELNRELGEIRLAWKRRLQLEQRMNELLVKNTD